MRINKQAIKELASKILKMKGVNKAELSILFAGKQLMRTLNKRFRNTDRVTDVLAFSLGEETYPGTKILGDVVICPQMACRFAHLYQIHWQEEIHLYLVHGILHLLGYTDTDARSRRQMQQEQKRILEKLRPIKQK